LLFSEFDAFYSYILRLAIAVPNDPLVHCKLSFFIFIIAGIDTDIVPIQLVSR